MPFEKLNVSNQELAKNSLKVVRADSDTDVKICHSLYLRYPAGVSANHVLFIKVDDDIIEQFKTTIRDLHHRGILHVEKKNGYDVYSMTADFYGLMKEVENQKNQT
jgi:hypothetical protein